MNKTTNHPINNFFQSLPMPMDIFNRHETKSPYSWLISDTPKSRLVEITQQLGEELLSRNISNRVIRKHVIERYRSEARRGEFLTTGQGLSVNINGKLIDGQHRLLALQAEGWPRIQMFVVTGLALKAVLCYDQHLTRRDADIFNMQHPTKKIKSRFFSVLNYVIQYNNKWVRSAWANLGNSQKETLIPIYENEINAVLSVGTPKSFFAAPHYAAFVAVAHKTGRLSEVCSFVGQVAQGINLQNDMPAYHLRNHVTMERGGSGSNIHQDRMLKAISAVKSGIDGKPMKLLRAAQCFDFIS